MLTNVSSAKYTTTVLPNNSCEVSYNIVNCGSFVLKAVVFHLVHLGSIPTKTHNTCSSAPEKFALSNKFTPNFHPIFNI